MLSSSPWVFLGRTSYAFYLVHFGVLATLIGSHLEGIDERLKVGLLFFATSAIAAVLFLLVEHPANTWIRRWAERLAQRKSLATQISDSGRRLRRAAIVWTCSFAVVFAIWRTATRDQKTLAGSTGGGTSQVQIDLPQFAHPRSAHTDFAGILRSFRLMN